MGQRHQIYIFYHTDNSRKKQLKKEIQCCVFHDQWCYGTLPLRNVVRFIRFQNKASGYQRISSSASYDNEDKFHALLALDLEAGVYGGAHDITGDVTTGEGWIDPDMGDKMMVLP